MNKVRQITDEYRLLGVLSTAPHSTVFKAAHPETGENVAIKLINPLGPVATAASRKRFEEAMKTMEKLSAPQIPGLLDYGFAPDENAFMVTSLIEGDGIHATGSQDLGQRCAVLADIGKALQILVKKKIPHNNVSPANVMIPVQEGGASAVVTGLGTAWFLSAGERVELLSLAPDSRRYAPPELRQGDVVEGAEAAQDSYAFAVLVCDLLGLSVEGLGGPEPQVTAPGSVVGTWKDAQALTKLLNAALVADPGTRKVAFDRIARLLNSGAKRLKGVGGVDIDLPAVDTGDAGTSTDSVRREEATDAPAGQQDPNKTNPALEAKVEKEEVPPTVAIPKAAIPPPLPPEPGPAPAPGDPTPAPPTAAVPAPQQPEPIPEVSPEAAPVPAPSKAKPGLPKWAIPAAGAAAIILVSVIVAVIVAGKLEQRRAAQAVPTPVPVPTRPPAPVETEVTSIHPRLEEAELAVQEEDVAAARVALEQLTALEVASFSETERVLHEDLQRAVEGISFRQAVDELRQGVRRGDISTLQRAVSSLSEATKEELASEPGLGGEIDRARRILRAYTMLQRAQRTGDAFQVIERADAMTSVLPAYKRAARLKRDAAARIVEQADAAISARRFADAIQTLEALEEAWAGYEGVQQRIELCRVRLRETQQMQTALAQIQELDRSGRPDEAIRMLESLEVGQQFAGQAANLKAAAQRHLRELDANAPTLELAEGAKLVFRKNDTLTIPIVVKDDYRVVEVRVMLRTDLESVYRDGQLAKKSGDRWELVLSPGVHNNRSVVFYAIAEDLSGNLGRLGTASQPIEVKRKKWFQP